MAEERRGTVHVSPISGKFPHKFRPVNARIVKYHKFILACTQRQPVKEVCDSFSRHILSCGESIISVITVCHAEYIESEASFRRYIHIPSTELPDIRHITFRADMTFIPRSRDQ